MFFMLIHCLPLTLPLQGQNVVTGQNVIVGLLVGKDDVRDLKLKTREGRFTVADSGNSKPFHLISNRPNHLYISFKTDPSDNQRERKPRGVEFKYFETERSLVSAILLNEVDYAVLYSEESVSEIGKGTKNYRILVRKPELNTTQLVCYNFANPILRSRDVRFALSHAINKKKIKSQILFEKADIAKSPFEAESIFHTSRVKEIKYNPKLAINLLEEAGWRILSRSGIRTRNGRPLRFRLLFHRGLDLEEKIVRQIKIDCIQIGVDVIPVPLSARALNDSLHVGNFDAVLLRYRFEESPSSVPDFFGSGAGDGFMKYRSKKFNFTYKLSRNLTGTTQIQTAINSMQVIINEDQPVTFLFHPWREYHIINAAKFEEFLGQDGLPLPFDDWLIRRQN